MNKFSTQKLCVSGALVALGFVCSLIKVIDMPMGGSVTLCSMMFISLIGFMYGPVVGFTSAIAYGILQFISNPYVLNIPQVLCDYIFAFGSLGLSGFFTNSNRHGLTMGYLCGAFGRFVFSFLSGFIFFAEYAPETMAAPLYSFLYNGAYLGAEALISIIVLNIPPFKKAIMRIKLSYGNEVKGRNERNGTGN